MRKQPRAARGPDGRDLRGAVCRLCAATGCGRNRRRRVREEADKPRRSPHEGTASDQRAWREAQGSENGLETRGMGPRREYDREQKATTHVRRRKVKMKTPQPQWD